MNVPATTPPNTQEPGPTTVAKVTTVYVTVAAPTPTIATTTDLGGVTPGPVGDYATTAIFLPSASPVAPTAVPPPPMLGPSTSDVHTGGITHPNQDQITTIWVAAVMLLAIMIGWNMIVIRSLLYPWKMLVNLIHEASHVFGEREGERGGEG